MSGRELIKLILDSDAEDCRIAVGCQGYVSTYNADESVRTVKDHDVLYILDSCAYDADLPHED